jgi:hypothetical protein
MTDYLADVKKYAKKVNEEAVAGIVRHCGIALRSKDASMVSCSQKSELERVRESFLKKKLERTESDDKLDEAIQAVCEKLGRSNKNKSRVSFYYLLAENYDKLDLFVKKTS